MNDSNAALEKAKATLVGVLTDHGRKPPRVLAPIIADHMNTLGLLATTPDELIIDAPAGHLVIMGERPDPPTWLRFAATLDPDETPVAVTRNRSDMAMRHLGLDPHEVRALVVEHDYLRVYRWTDRTAAQTVPILEEPA